MQNKIMEIKSQISKAIVGKEEVIEKILMAILAGGHVLLEDIPGVGKTTLALAFSKAMGMDFKRVQFTPDVVPSDITGYSIYNKTTNQLEYRSGAAMCNLLLADEINRTSSKTQSALLEVMQEGSITVDGETREMPDPFVVIATQNPLGTIGTQMLPEAQLDRFMIQLSMGYPSFQAQVQLLAERRNINPLDKVEEVLTIQDLLKMQEMVKNVHIDRKVYEYVTMLTEKTRNSEVVKLGVSPRGALALCSIAQASALISGRDYVTPSDVEKVFIDVCKHRIILNPKAHLMEMNKTDILEEILKMTEEPKMI